MADTSTKDYVGRFAPSPTGPLHLGSLVAALASYLDARHCNGKWLVRIEDIDPPREIPGAADAILKTLEAHGLHWDSEITYQSCNTERYEQAITRLSDLQRTFHCQCSRQQLQNHSIYPGTCRKTKPQQGAETAIRLKVDGLACSFLDLVQGQQDAKLETTIGDFVIRRKDGLFSYQLAVALDDHFQGITRVVRGADLLDSSLRQIAILQLLGAKLPEYAHIPVLTDQYGEKLSKQTQAAALQAKRASENLVLALLCLNHSVPEGLKRDSTEAILDWAEKNWQLSNVSKKKATSITATN